MTCLLEWVGRNADCNSMLVDETKVLAHHERKIVSKALPIFQQGVNEDPKLCIEAKAQITAAVYAMHEAIV